LIFAVLLPTFKLYCKIRSRDLTTPTLGVIGHANTYFTKYEVSIFNRSEDRYGYQIRQKGHVTQATPISRYITNFFIRRQRV